MNQYQVNKHNMLSNFGAFLSAILSSVLLFALLSFSEVQVSDMPILVAPTLWFIFTVAIMMLFDRLGI